MPPILAPQDGFLFLDRAKFADSFAADVDPAEAAFMADSQCPGAGRLWPARSPIRPGTQAGWYLVATDDRMIPPDAQRQMASRAGATVAETPGSHAIYVSNPTVVAERSKQAAAAVEAVN